MINKEIRKRPLVLIVDDINENLRLIGNILTENNYSVAFASNGEKGIKAAITSVPDLILLDIGLPDIEGYEVCKELKVNSKTAEVPIIFITAHNDSDDIVKGFRAGAVDYITKPFHQPEFLARIKTHIDLKYAKERIEELSYFDEGSGVANKRYFNKFFEIEWKKAIRNKNEISIIMIDVDYFKSYNDIYGHIEGDKCLAKIARTISNCLERPSDFVARFGGEEFVCVLPETDRIGAFIVAEKIRKKVESINITHRKTNNSEVVTVSLGVNTVTPDSSSDMLEFVYNADNALYSSKNNGRNRVS